MALLRRFRTGIPAAVAMLAACSGGSPATHQVTQATLDSLPTLAVTEGRQLCEADGKSYCPFVSALGNWLDTLRFVTWEPGRQVALWTPGTAQPRLFGADTGSTTSMVTAIAVGAGSHGDLNIIELTSNGVTRMVRFDSTAHRRDSLELPQLTGMQVRGILRATPTLTTVRPGKPSARYVVEKLRALADTQGQELFSLPVPWMPQYSRGLRYPPFFAPWPTFAMDQSGGVAWTEAEHFEIHRTDAGGKQRWEIVSDLTGPPTSKEQIAERRKSLEMSAVLEAIPAVDLDSMVAETLPHHPAIAGIAVDSHGQLLVSGANVPGVDSVIFYRISNDGVLNGRFKLPDGTQVMLFAGDSILVHRKTLNEFREVRWLHIGAGSAAPSAH